MTDASEIESEASAGALAGPTVMRPDEMITIALEARQWNVVLDAVYSAPYRAVADIIAVMQKQFAAHPPRRQPNGKAD